MIRGLPVLAALALAPVHPGAMEVSVAGDQLILRGSLVGDELAKMRDTLPVNPRISTVVLQDSPGGDVWTAMRLGELFQERGFRTAASGFCMSACVIVFLGGRERFFAIAGTDALAVGLVTSKTVIQVNKPAP